MKILCLNCFGIPISLNKRLRFELIAKNINSLNPDIAFLQEVIDHKDKMLLEKVLKPEGWNFYSEKNGLLERGGVVTISKIKGLKYREFVKFVNQGPKKLITVPDKILGKGFHWVKLPSRDIVFVNVHILCPYARREDDIQAQADQLNQLMLYIKTINSKNIVVVGDFNLDPDSNLVKKLKKDCSLSDTLTPNDFTIDLKNLNRGKLMNIFSDGKNYRTDYIFINKNIKNIKTKIVFIKPEVYKGKKIHLSDHYGILSEIN